MLNPNAQKLVNALRSGKYKQCTKVLEKYGANCCLGVACRLYQEEVGNLRVSIFDGSTEFDGTEKVLPTKVQNWLGFKTYTGGGSGRLSRKKV